MSDSLHPLRHAYGLDDRLPEGGAVEGELLRQMRRLLEAAPPVRPEPATIAAVEAAAAEAGEYGALRAMLDGGAVGPEASTEAELIRQSLAALDTLPSQAPSDDALAAVFLAAADASAALAPIRAAYGLGDASVLASADPVEVALLTQTRAALDAARREQRPDDATLDAVLAHAAAASLADDRIPASAPDLAAVYGQAPVASVSAALMAGADAALDRLPAARPSDDALAAVLAAAAAATRDARPAASAPVATPTATPAVPLGGARRIASPSVTAAPAAMWARRPAVWASIAATLAAVVIVANLFGSEPTALPEVAALAEEAPSLVAEEAPDTELAPSAALPPPPSASEPTPISSGAAALAAGGPMAGVPATASPLQPRAVFGAPPVQAAPGSAAPSASVPRSASQPARSDALQPVRAQAPAAPAPAAPRPAPRREAATDLTLSAIAAAPAASAKTSDSWEAGEDVRLLSLRLQELRRQNQGLGWDDAEAFGAPAVGAVSATPGVQSVGFGRLNAVPAARARAIVDSTNDRR